MGTERDAEHRRRRHRTAGGGDATNRRTGETGTDAGPERLPSQPGNLRPDLALGLWTSWMEANAGAVRDWSGAGRRWWQLSPDDLAGSGLGSGPEAGARRLNDVLAKDPLLRSIDGLWNANPFRSIVPVDWAEVARALRTVWMLSLSRPDKVVRKAADVQAAAWTSAMEAWNDAGRRWWGMVGGTAAASAPPPGGDKRFAAPEWHGNPVYRTLKEMYLLASDWLLEEGGAPRASTTPNGSG